MPLKGAVFIRERTHRLVHSVPFTGKRLGALLALSAPGQFRPHRVRPLFAAALDRRNRLHGQDPAISVLVLGNGGLIGHASSWYINTFVYGCIYFDAIASIE